jgi:isochorismate synthase
MSAVAPIAPVNRSPHAALIAAARSLADLRGSAALLSHVAELSAPPDPMAFLAAATSAIGHGALWSQPRTGLTLVGAGAALEIRADGPGRFDAAGTAARDIAAQLVTSGSPAAFPILGGFAFDTGSNDGEGWSGFPDALLVIPRVTLQICGARALLRTTLDVPPGAGEDDVAAELDEALELSQRWIESPLAVRDLPEICARSSVPAREDWERSVVDAISAIERGWLDKVVLAREERLFARAAFDPIATLHRLRQRDDRATLFAMQTPGGWFLGATPERLVSLRGRRVEATCLAGSIAIDRDEAERERLARRLLASAKDREEHEIVVRSTVAALGEVCEEVVRLAGTPRVVAARSVQHLETPLAGKLTGAGHILDLVARLHPTPAVGGFPRREALSLIRELETFARGWYAGPFGWMDLDGGGEFAVAIRSALLSGCVASLFGGCGIVHDSLPAAEFAETELKMRPMLTALGAV